MGEHVGNHPAAVFLAVVPRWPLPRLPVALKHPVAELAAHREDAPKEAAVHQALELEQTGQPQLVLHHAVLDPRLPRLPRQVQGGGQVVGQGLLAVDLLAGGNRLAHAVRPLSRRLGVEVDRVLRVGQAGVQVGAPPLQAVRLRQCPQLGLAPPHQDRLREGDIPVGQRHPALLADGEDRADEVLIRPHAPRDAVHDDANGLHSHRNLLWVHLARYGNQPP